MGKNNNPFYNASGCADPTAYYGTKEIIKEETESISNTRKQERNSNDEQ